MAKRRNPHVGRTLGAFVAEQRAKDPEFAAEWDKRQFARRIRQLREGRSLTQSELANRAHTTQSAIARLESGSVVPRLDLLHKIAAALGLRLSVDFLPRHSHSAAGAG